MERSLGPLEPLDRSRVSTRVMKYTTSLIRCSAVYVAKCGVGSGGGRFCEVKKPVSGVEVPDHAVVEGDPVRAIGVQFFNGHSGHVIAHGDGCCKRGSEG